ncbi:YIP1 family protein [Marivivens aquimaris]|uniref:YIP1 family protein n=1 Tax=Marivivens aquimaris TaxID=2774876 RepID=UPI0018830820|nr:YIP1 family protein [Marivivens aquimaris]
MSVSRDMIRTWRAPRAVMRKLLAMGKREDRALAFLMGGCFIVFISQWPALARQAHITGEEMSQLVAYSLLGWIFIWPLLFYGLAAVAHLIAKVLGGKGTFFTARLAMFWTLLATSPAGLFYGLLLGLNGAVPGTHFIGGLWLAAFAVILLLTLTEAEKGA